MKNVRPISNKSETDSQPGGFHPLYSQIKELMIARLVDGTWRAGDYLPSEMKLAAELGVSQGTVRKALDEMTAENLLVRQQGKGTLVNTHSPDRTLFRFFHLVGKDEVRRLPSSKIIKCVTGKANRQERKKLNLSAGDNVIRIYRLRFLEKSTTITERIVVPSKLFPRLGSFPDQIPNTLYQIYEAKYGVTVRRAVERISAVAADQEEAALLGVKKGAPLLEIDRLAINMRDDPVEWRVSRCETSNCVYLSALE